MDYDDELRLSCEKTGDPLNKRFSKARLGSNWVGFGSKVSFDWLRP